MGSFSQDLLISENGLPDAAARQALGLNPATTRLEVVTEFLAAPQPVIQTNILAGTPWPDQSLDFGEIKSTVGRAFLLGGQAPG